jgi:hypothetical protein
MIDAFRFVAVGVPIIIVPNAPTSMVTLHNVKALLESGTCVTAAKFWS